MKDVPKYTHWICSHCGTKDGHVEGCSLSDGDGPNYIEVMRQHLKNCLDYIEIERPRNTPRCPEWQAATHFLVYEDKPLTRPIR